MDEIKTWTKAALIRAVKSTAQSAVALIGTTAINIVSLDWAQIAGVCATMFVLSILTSVAGIPEVDEGKSVFQLASGSEKQ